MVMDVQALASLEGPQKQNEERIFSILFKEDDLSWQTIIYDLVKTEQMDPWDINISTIADKFIGMLRKMQEMDFRVGGKMILAAALLVKIKSEKLMKEDITAFDNLFANNDVELLEGLEDDGAEGIRGERPKLVPRTPQPRQRKVSVYDLVEALEKALHTETRKQFNIQHTAAPEVKVPAKPTDMSSIINTMYQNMKIKFGDMSTFNFNEIIPSPTKEDKVHTFIPLLHLDTQRKIDILQKEHFGDILIKLNKEIVEPSSP
jgi:segregation and condensation protein A